MLAVMRRRDFIPTVGAGIAVQPIPSLAQQGRRPVVGLIGSTSPHAYASRIAAFNRGLGEAGYTDGKNVTIEYRWAEGHYDRLASLADEVVREQVNVIAAITTPVALAVKATTTTIPTVFEVGGDPVELGLVASLNRPGGLRGGIALTSADGYQYEIRNRMTVCRCGASKNKPFCDGSHTSIKFKAKTSVE
jgi:putative tryptophan/tyrosine transport system substrate-binding protein